MNNLYKNEHFQNIRGTFTEIEEKFKKLFKDLGLILNEEGYIPTQEDINLLKEIVEFCQWTTATTAVVESQINSRIDKLKQ